MVPTTMAPFTNLNFSYPGIHDTARLHALHSSERSLHHTPINTPVAAQDCDHLAAARSRAGSSKTMRTWTTLDRTAGRNSRHQRQRSLPGSRSSPLDYTNLLANLYYMDDSSDLPDRYVPSSSDKLTCSDHRPLDQIFGKLHVSSRSSLPIAPPIRQFRSESTHGRPQSTSVLTYALPTKPQLDGVIQIPLLAVDNQMTGTDLVVPFRCSDWGIGVPIEGIPMSDLLLGNISALEGPHERVLDGFGLINLRLNILWPNYAPFAKMISAFGTDGQPLTRAGLGYEVALAFAEFYWITLQGGDLGQPSETRAGPGHGHGHGPANGPYTIASSKPGSTVDGITFEHLWLVTVRNTSFGEWMAEVRAVLGP